MLVAAVFANNTAFGDVWGWCRGGRSRAVCCVEAVLGVIAHGRKKTRSADVGFLIGLG